jgi:hypothetical protein
VRKLFILQSLRHAPGYPISFHKVRVKMMAREWNATYGKAADECGQFTTEFTLQRDITT